ncbi:MAG: hypothetical protein RIF33_03395 [Cyclobacteriaceae bacterium]
MEVYELDKEVILYLEKRGLIAQYKKAKTYLKNTHATAVQFKKRKPYSEGKYYFRINRKYRAIGVFDGQDFIVIEIDDHQ